jgi:hypothetical protein
VGDMKVQGAPFIQLPAGATGTVFTVCSTGGTQLKTLGSGTQTVRYNCTSPPCLSNQVSVHTGYGTTMCFTEGVQYSIRETSGYQFRNRLFFTFPVGYTECVAGSATRFD